MNKMVIIIVFAVISVVFAVIWDAMHSKRNRKPVRKSKTSEVINMLSGEVTDIRFDKENSLSLITVKDKEGVIWHGLSNVSVHELNMLYMNKGHVQIPVVTKRWHD